MLLLPQRYILVMLVMLLFRVLKVFVILTLVMLLLLWEKVKEYVHLLEEAVIRVCASFGIAAGRLEKATGVWLEGDTPRARKICAIGVRSSHFVTMHGLALNVNTDLRYFSYINPCGFIDKGVTSLQKELGHEVPMEELKERLCKELVNLLS